MSNSAPALKTPTSVHRAYSLVVRRWRADPNIHRLLFGYRPSGQINGQLWDWTTLRLKSVLKRYASPGASLLDMGTGPAAVLAIYAKLQLDCRDVWAADHLTELLHLASLSASGCGADITFSHSSLFSAIDRAFDLIVFNAPYIAADAGWRLGAFQSKTEAARWSGGGNGLLTITNFLDSVAGHLTPTGRVFLGVNHFYLSAVDVRRAIATAGMDEIETRMNRLTLACVYVLSCKTKPGHERAVRQA